MESTSNVENGAHLVRVVHRVPLVGGAVAAVSRQLVLALWVCAGQTLAFFRCCRRVGVVHRVHHGGAKDNLNCVRVGWLMGKGKGAGVVWWGDQGGNSTLDLIHWLYLLDWVTI